MIELFARNLILDEALIRHEARRSVDGAIAARTADKSTTRSSTLGNGMQMVIRGIAELPLD
jgi:hypothetical protein